MSGIAQWWSGLSNRERRLIVVMLAVVAFFVGWLGIWRPVHSAIDDGWASYGAAVDRNAAVRARLEQLARLPAQRGAASAVDAEQLVTQSAAEAGLTLDRSAGQGAGRLAVTISSARAGALLAWLSALEAQGIVVETLSMTPAAMPGTVAVQAVLRSGA